ncbi:PLP-dependent aminotransferase family protein [Gorillibacterium massiliense]|uniref:MocR-like pyridoxine biosynthesis transcription factor PdxR n=1 Tax=Gorillibacterium massiliense TaxID=1280390 RepID=UPI0004B589DC|nr:PLP-dependent aminotransferase family protein [Gorillibacterium massiliense]
MEFQIAYSLYRTIYKTKQEALYYGLKAALEQGAVPAGARLPASRELAALYGISRGTVNQVYEMLTAEGYLASRAGSGTFSAYEDTRKRTRIRMAELQLSDWGERLQNAPSGMEPAQGATNGRKTISYAINRSDLSRFPFTEWNQALRDELRQRSGREGERVPTEGFLPLREAIAQYIHRTRGLEASADDIVIVNGSMQAIALLSLILIRSEDSVVMENPVYHGISHAVRMAGGKPLFAEMDEFGMIPEKWSARLLFATPNRQFPTGAVLPLERRFKLLDWASEQSAVIVEDDYDSDFRHRGTPVEPLKRLDREGRVAYIGTFSKSLPAGLRLGYAILPPALKPAFLQAKRLFEPFASSVLEQRTLATFIRTGGFERHLRRMRHAYSRKYKRLEQELMEKLGDRFRIVPSDSGLHLFAWWKGTEDDWHTFGDYAREAGVIWEDASRFFHQGSAPSACFGVGGLDEEDLVEGVKRITAISDRMKQSP